MAWYHCTGTVQSGTGGGNREKVVLKVWLEDLRWDTQRRHWSDVLWQTVPYTSSDNQKGSVAEGRQLSVANDQR